MIIIHKYNFCFGDCGEPLQVFLLGRKGIQLALLASTRIILIPLSRWMQQHQLQRCIKCISISQEWLESPLCLLLYCPFFFPSICLFLHPHGCTELPMLTAHPSAVHKPAGAL